MSLLRELKRRNVFRVGGAYIVVAWLLIQVAETIFPLFGYDDTPARIVVIICIIGFVPSIAFAWAFELTPEGLKKEKDVDRAKSITRQTGKKLDRAIIVVLGLSVSYFAFDKFVLSESREASIAEQARMEGRSEALVDSYGDKSIAVLAFKDMSPEEDQEYLSDGIAEELLNLLARVPGLRVISRTSAFSYKGKDKRLDQIAEELNVAYILEGSVRKAGNQLRITAQLIEAHSDSHIWSETYNRSLDDIFDIQDAIAAEVVDELKINLLGEMPRQPETDPEAYAIYLQADYLTGTSTVEGIWEAIALNEQVLAIDPEYAPALLSIGLGFDRLGTVRALSQDEARRNSRRAIERALEIDPEYAFALNSLAWRVFRYDRDFQQAARLFEKALQKDPTNSAIIGNISVFLGALGRLDEAIQFGKYQVSRDPAYAVAHNNLGGRYRYARNYEEAKQAFSAARRLSPNLGGVNYEIGLCLLLEGNHELAKSTFESEAIPVFRQIGLTMAHFSLGQHAESRAMLDDLITKYGERIPYYIGLIMAHQREIDNAYEWLENARQSEDSALSNIHIEPLLRPLHSDPRWRSLLESIDMAPDQLNVIEFSVSLQE